MAEATKRVARKRTASPASRAIKASEPEREPSSILKTEIKQPNIPPWESLLDPGDKVEFGTTVEVRDDKGRTAWPKANTMVTVRPGETASQAVERAVAVTWEVVMEQAQAFKDA